MGRNIWPSITTSNFFTYEDEQYRPVREFDYEYRPVTGTITGTEIEWQWAMNQILGMNTNNKNTKETNKMEAKKCDRCGKLYEMPGAKENDGADVRFKHMYVYGAEDMSGNKIAEKQTKRIWVKAEYDGAVDLCPACRASLKKWFESTDKEEKK